MAKASFSTPIRGLLPSGAVSSPLRKFGEDRYLVQLAGQILNASDELSSAAAPDRRLHHWRADRRARCLPQRHHIPRCRTACLRPMTGRLSEAGWIAVCFDGCWSSPSTVPSRRSGLNTSDCVSRRRRGFAPRLGGRGSETGYQRRYFAEPESSRVALREWVLGADPVLAWLEEAVTIVIGNMPARVKKRASRTSVSEPPRPGRMAATRHPLP
jgi:putative DNA primase/helicase